MICKFAPHYYSAAAIRLETQRSPGIYGEEKPRQASNIVLLSGGLQAEQRVFSGPILAQGLIPSLHTGVRKQTAVMKEEQVVEERISLAFFHVFEG